MRKYIQIRTWRPVWLWLEFRCIFVIWEDSEILRDSRGVRHVLRLIARRGDILRDRDKMVEIYESDQWVYNSAAWGRRSCCCGPRQKRSAGEWRSSLLSHSPTASMAVKKLSNQRNPHFSPSGKSPMRTARTFARKRPRIANNNFSTISIRRCGNTPNNFHWPPAACDVNFICLISKIYICIGLA